MVRCRAKGENYSYDFAASLQNTNEQSNLISERDLTAWKGAAERMLTNEIVLKVFSDYLARDDDFEVVLTSKGYTVMGFAVVAKFSVIAGEGEYVTEYRVYKGSVWADSEISLDLEDLVAELAALCDPYYEHEQPIYEL